MIVTRNILEENYEKKLNTKVLLLLALVTATVLLISCTSAKQTAPANVIETAVSATDKYGNCTLAVSPEDFVAAGYATGDIAKVVMGNVSFEAPVVTNYSDVDTGNYLLRLRENAVSVAINLGNLADTSDVEVGSPVTISMQKKEGYLSQYEVRQLKRTEERSDYATDEIFANFRAVKAGKIATNRLYRSCNPVLNDSRAPYATALMEKAGIQTVLNLADSRESAATNMAAVPYYANLAEHGDVIFLDMAISFTEESFAKKLHDGLVFMVQHQASPYLVHCNEGKDRAGFVSAILEAICDATLEEMEADYMISFENYFGVQKGTDQYKIIAQTIPDIFKTLNNGKPVTNKNVKRVAENYLLNTVGLTPSELSMLKVALQ